ncbi:MAG: peptide-methionine (S)-S-oxide reductase MsrA [Methanoregulaceae archaeon]|nr:peptide-methionine (S)-S-oxide reductase MsrA [Methanoregulaceae archaeon]
MTDKNGKDVEKATFGAGCFWGVEAIFRSTKGVVDTSVGYMGGNVKNPTYKLVCGGDTGHTEVVEVMYDPQIVSYDRLLDIFFENHDPTTMNRQGPDIGRQYRSVIFYHSPAQKEAAEAKIAALDRSGRFRGKIVTAVEPVAEYYKAEQYHQQYYEKCGGGSCHR